MSRAQCGAGPCYPVAQRMREARRAAIPFPRLVHVEPDYIAVDETQEPVEDAGLRSDAALFFPGR